MYHYVVVLIDGKLYIYDMSVESDYTGDGVALTSFSYMVSDDDGEDIAFVNAYNYATKIVLSSNNVLMIDENVAKHAMQIMEDH